MTMHKVADRLILFPRGRLFALTVLEGKVADNTLMPLHLVGLGTHTYAKNNLSRRPKYYGYVKEKTFCNVL